MAMFFPSTYPRSRRPRRNPSVWCDGPDSAHKKPIRGAFFLCCASTNGAVDSRAVVSRQTTSFLFTPFPFLTIAYRIMPVASLEELPDLYHQLVLVDRFGKVIVAARLARVDFVTDHGMGSHGDNGD